MWRLYKCTFILIGLGLFGCDPSPIILRPLGMNKVGYVQVAFVDEARHRPLDVGLWYPAADSASEAPIIYDRGYLGVAAEGGPYESSTSSQPRTRRIGKGLASSG